LLGDEPTNLNIPELAIGSACLVDQRFLTALLGDAENIGLI